MALKSKRIHVWGKDGYDNATFAGPHTPWPDMAWIWTNFPSSNPNNAWFFDLQRGEDAVTYSNQVSLLGKVGRDIGSEFDLYRQIYSDSSEGQVFDLSESADPNAPGYHYRGPQKAIAVDGGLGPPWPEADRYSANALTAMGATAISRCIPTNPLWSLTQFLGELREGLPRIAGSSFFKDRARTAKQAGDEYLNVEFGWLPLVSDIRNFCYAVTNAERVLDQYRRNSGKWIKRRYSFPDETSTETWKWTGSSNRPVPQLPPAVFSSWGDTELTLVKQKVRRVWFEGVFCYYLGEPGSFRRREQEANKILGTRLTPETLWNLSPWTWMADWFTNIGDVIHNIGAFANDGLVMPYGYVMEHSTVTDSYKSSGWQYKSAGMPSEMTQTFHVISKRRIQASPFGFGLTSGDLSTRQLAILGSLGLQMKD